MNEPRDEDQREDQRENNLDGSKLSIEEVGGACSNLHDETKDKQEPCCRCLLLADLTWKEIKQLIYMKLYLMYGPEDEISRQYSKIMSNLKRDNYQHWSTVTSLNHTPDADNYTMSIPICGKKLKFDVRVDQTKCYCSLMDSEDDSFSFEKIQDKSRKCCTNEINTRLPQNSLPACFEFRLLCTEKSTKKTPINFTITVTNVDENGKEIHTTDINYPACFFNLEFDEHQSIAEFHKPKERQILEQCYDEIHKKFKIKSLEFVITWLEHHDVIDKRFVNSISTSKDKEGELLRHLTQYGNALPQFIKALQASDVNKELVEFLQKHMSCTEDQTSSL